MYISKNVLQEYDASRQSLLSDFDQARDTREVSPGTSYWDSPLYFSTNEPIKQENGGYAPDAGDGDEEDGLRLAAYIILAALTTLGLLGCAFGWWLGAAARLLNFG